jgi:hypothetical protein
MTARARWAAASLLAAAVASLATGARAEPLPPERLALVREFLAVTEMAGGTAPLRGAFVERVEERYAQTFEAMLAEMALAPDEAERARERYDESRRRFRDAFARLFDEQVDLDLLTRVLYGPIYARHFSDDELRELIAFYRSPVGRKSLEALPRAMTEITLEVGPALAPIVTSLVNEAVAIEKAALRDAID